MTTFCGNFSVCLSAHLQLKRVTNPYCEQSHDYFKTNTNFDSTHPDLFSCSVCLVIVVKEKLRENIAKHIILGELINNANTCGYCGGCDYNIELKKISGFGKRKTLGAVSNCKSYCWFSIKPA